MCIINEVTPLYLHVRAWYVANVGQGHRKDKKGQQVFWELSIPNHNFSAN